MKTERFPNIPRELLVELEKRFPNVLPVDPHTTINEVNIRQGQQEVIRLLRSRFDIQNTTVLESQ
ncbi:hypothetical protein J3A69_003319 [Pseudomonas putida]|nr:hypothetical protein [Pseudomonas sp. PvP089]MBP2090124.1 hypothetical protein [Pseudomonas sp. PvP088]MBP2223712.1 hypothetical protein [Pseudomonas putida]